MLWLLAITVFNFLLASGVRAQSSGVNPQLLQQQSSDSPTHGAQDQAPITAYKLSPERYQKAHELGRAYFIYQLVEFVVSVSLLILMLRFRVGVIFARWAERFSQRKVVQAFTFTPLLVLVLVLLLLPADIYRHSLSMRYGLSIQGWPSWLWDWTKFQLVLLLLASFTSWILYTIIRKSPRRWWFYFWLASLPLSLFLVFFQPLIFDPLFHKFEPLAQKEPVLAQELQKLVRGQVRTFHPKECFGWKLELKRRR